MLGAWRYDAQLDDRLAPELAGAEIRVRGTVASLPQQFPDHLRFLFRPTERQAELGGLPRRIQVRWYDNELTPQAGESWRLKLRLRPPRGLVNFQGFDRERALFAAGIGALASVIDGGAERLGREGRSGADGIRATVRERIREALTPGQGRALVLSLAIADRSELERESWTLLRATGTGHLLAISGLHVGLAAVAGFWAMRVLLFLFRRFSGGRAGFLACCGGAFLAALGYGALAGFPVSTIRALVMLAAGLWVIAGRRGTAAFQAWVLALLVVLLIDPFSPLGAGFWLSFGAVLALIVFFSPRGPAGSWWTALPRAQLAVMLVMLPLSAFWFQSGSWLAFPTNLLAIPWVSFLSVPLVLAGVASLPIPAIAEPFLLAASWSCELLVELLQVMESLEGGRRWLTPNVGTVITVLGLLGGLLLLLPRGLAVRWLGAWLIAVLVLPRALSLDQGEFTVESLDVGQGQAVLVKTRRHSLLYDTGPGDGQTWSLFDSVIAPALAADARAPPDLVAVSHADLDHAGGLADFIARYGNDRLRYNRPEARPLPETGPDSAPAPCHDDQSWAWDGVEFTVLHPSRWLPYRGNDSSCVISVDNGRYRALLSGDVGEAVEDRLADSLGRHHLVTVPHHGSASSSGPAFLEAARPSWAVVSAAYGNRFGFPRPEVVGRYRRQGAEVFTTIDCGAVRAVYPRDGEPELRAARLERDRPWRWWSGSGCNGRE